MNSITIIGGGNLGSAIAEGIINAQIIPPSQLTVTRRNTQALEFLKEKGVQINQNNKASLQSAKYIIFAVKPYQIAEIIKDLLPGLNPDFHVLISVITGVSIDDFHDMLGEKFPIVRAMPNTAIAVKESMTCISSAACKNEDLQFIQNIFNQVGKSILIDENLMDAATVLGACGTAYAMRFIRANIQGGIEIGFSAQTAALIAAQTVKGAAHLLLERNTHPEQEIDKVTTPKGCTIAGLNEMEHQGFSSSLIKGIATSYQKIKKDM